MSLFRNTRPARRGTHIVVQGDGTKEFRANGAVEIAENYMSHLFSSKIKHLTQPDGPLSYPTKSQMIIFLRSFRSLSKTAVVNAEGRSAGRQGLPFSKMTDKELFEVLNSAFVKHCSLHDDTSLETRKLHGSIGRLDFRKSLLLRN